MSTPGPPAPAASVVTAASAMPAASVVTAARAASAVRVVSVYPDLLGTYGDAGNATVLAQRLRWRGMQAEVLTVDAGQAVPEGGDVYLVGGGEDLPQALAARKMRRHRGLQRAVEGGAALLAVCAGLQVIGTSFVGPDGVEEEGAGLLDVRSVRGRRRRAVGELVVEPDPGSGLPVLTGYENHASRTILGPGLRPAGKVRSGVGNGTGGGRWPGSPGAGDGVWSGRVWCTYLHGPVLARNPALADLLLRWVVGDLAPLEDPDCEILRSERLASAAREASGVSARMRALLPRRAG